VRKLLFALVLVTGIAAVAATVCSTGIPSARAESSPVVATAPGAPSISGRVTNEFGSPLEGQTVTINQWTNAARTEFTTVETLVSTWSADWTVELDAPGTYFVKIINTSGGYVSEFYDDVWFTDVEYATPIVVADGTAVTGIDSALARAAHSVQGRITTGGSGVLWAVARPWEYRNERWNRLDTWDSADTYGYYYVGGLPVGSFIMEYSSPNRLTEYSGNAPSPELASSFGTSMTSAVTNLDADMLPDPYRAAGGTRYSTAVAASRATYPSERTKTVVIASGTGFADALAASALAGAVDGPVLLASRYDVPEEVLDEIERLGATKAYVVGGTGALDDFVLRALKTVPGMTYPTRIAGSDRYETSAEVAKTVAELDGSAFSHGAFIARGDTFPDALAAGPFAYSQGMPVLLTRPGSLPTSVSSTIESLDITRTVICGDTTAVSTDVQTAIEALNSGATATLRRGGTTRYDTSASIARYGIDQGWCMPHYQVFGYATGTNFPDALAGASSLGARRGCMMLVTPSLLPGSVRDATDALKGPEPQVFVLGDTGVVSATVLNEIQSVVTKP